LPCHHTLEGYLAEYIERARLGEVARVPLFQAIKYRPYGRGEAQLNGERLHRTNAWQMVRRRGKAAGITTEVCNPHLPGHRDHRLPRERRHAREGTPDGGAYLHSHYPPTTGARTGSRLMKS
jgi:hypothetical protein